MESSMLRKRMPVTALADPAIVVPAIWASFAKLDPRVLIKNPVMFVVEIVAALTTIIFVRDLFTGGANLGFTFQIMLWLWITVLFANFSEAVAEGRGKAQAESLRQTRTETQAKLLSAANSKDLQARPRHQPEGRRHRPGGGRRSHPLRRRGDRGRRLASTRRRSPANRHPSSANPAATARRSPAARR